MEVARAAMEKLEGQLRAIPARLQRLKKSGMRKLSGTDGDSRFLPDRRGFTLGYPATLAVSDDHLIVAQQVSRERAIPGSISLATTISSETGKDRTPGQIVYSSTSLRSLSTNTCQYNLSPVTTGLLDLALKPGRHPLF